MVIEIPCETANEYNDARETGHEIITPGEVARFISPDKDKAIEVSFLSLGLGWGKPAVKFLEKASDGWKEVG
jgi:hypothetical protein